MRPSWIVWVGSNAGDWCPCKRQTGRRGDKEVARRRQRYRLEGRSHTARQARSRQKLEEARKTSSHLPAEGA